MAHFLLVETLSNDDGESVGWRPVKIDVSEDNTITLSFPGSKGVTPISATFGDCPPYHNLGEALDGVRKEMLHSYDVVTILHHGN